MRQFSLVISRISIAAIVSTVAACGGVPNYQVIPKISTPISHKIGNENRIPHPNHMNRYLDNNQTIVYTQNFGGGGVGVGLLGPFGVAANMNMIEEITKSDTLKLKGKIRIDVNAIYKSVFTSVHGLSGASGLDNAATITPVVDVIKMSDDKVGISTGLIVDYNPAKITWKGKYRYKLDKDYSLSGIASGWSDEQKDSFKQSVANGFREVTKLYRDDVNKQLTKIRDIKFKSEFTSPRFNFDQMGYEVGGNTDRIYIRSFGVVFSLLRQSVVITDNTKPVQKNDNEDQVKENQ